MQRFALLASTGGALALAEQESSNGPSSNPMNKVLQLMNELSAKLTKDGDAEAASYQEYFEWCDDTTKNTGFAIVTAARAQEKLEATIGELTGNIAAADSTIEDLAADIAKGQKELKDATEIRRKEAEEFVMSEGELSTAINTLGRAIGILSKEMAKNPASFAQVDTRNMANAMQAISAILDAASFPSKDQSQLAAFVQSKQAEDSDSDDLELGAPAGAVYKTQSTGILDVLEDLKEKAEGQLADLRKAEVNTRQNFEMLKQSLEDQIAADTKDMDDTKAAKASAAEQKATAEGDLDKTNKEFASSKHQLATSKAACIQVAADHEATIAARKDELSVIAQAQKTLQETSGGAVEQTYDFLQMQMLSRSDLAGSEVAAAVKRLAKKHHSSALAQLASRISSVLRLRRAGSDPFTKIKGLITSMINRLEKTAADEAAEKAYCDEQLAKTEAKKDELEQDLAAMTATIDKAAARQAQLKEEVQVLEQELAALTKEQAGLDKIRQETHAEYAISKADLEQGLSGVRQALETLREYYGGAAAMLQEVAQDDSKFGAFMQQPSKPELHGKSQGAGESIMNILQVVESDFATNLAKEEAEESDAQSEYEKITQENAVTKTTKDQSVKYKTQEAKAQDKTVAEYSGDRDTANEEYAAVMDYYAKIKDRCIAKPETYAARKARRAAEIEGLKEALSILEDETALVQRKRRGSFRGAMAM